MISKQHRVIFVRIPNTASSSIDYALAQHYNDIIKKNIYHHLNYQPNLDKSTFDINGNRTSYYATKHTTIHKFRLNILLSNDKFRKYFSFAFVRNPFERFVSKYAAQIKMNKNGVFLDGEKVSFNKWLLWHYENKHPRITKQQISWLTKREQVDQEILVNFVGKFENLQNNIKYIENKLGIILELPRLNVSEHKHYSKYYNQQSKDIVYKCAKNDLKRFNYNFDHN